MKIIKSNLFIVISLSLLILLLLIYLFLGDKYFKGNKTFENKIAFITRLNNSIQVKKKDDISWNKGAEGEGLFLGQKIFTQDKSSAEITFVNGHKILVDEKTLMTISEYDDFIDIDLEKGFIDIEIVGENKNIYIKSKDQKMLLSADKNSKVKVSRGDKGAALLTSLISGTVNIVDNGRKNTLQKETKFELSSSGVLKELPGSLVKKSSSYRPFKKSIKAKKVVPIKKTRLSELVLTAPLNKALFRYAYTKNIEGITLKWEDNLADYYIVNLYLNKKLLTRSKVFKNNFLIKGLVFGEFSWRVEAYKKGMISIESEVLTFNIIKKNHFVWESPKREVILEYYSKEEKVNFKWKGNKEYLLRIKKGGEVIHEIPMGDKKEYLINPDGVSFNWEFFEKDNLEKILSYGNVFVKHMSRPKNNEKIIIYHPEQKIYFIWQAPQEDKVDKDLFSYRLIFSHEESFAQTITSFPLKEHMVAIEYNKMDLGLSFRPLYWKILRGGGGQTLEQLEDQYGKIRMFLPQKSTKIRAPVLKRITLLEASKNNHYKVSIPKYKNANFYHLELYQDYGQKIKLGEKSSSQSEFIWKRNFIDEYYTKAFYIDFWGNRSPPSNIGMLIAPIAPFYDNIKKRLVQ